MMNKYNIVAVFWEDHIQVTRSALVDNPDDLFDSPMLSVGILYKETPKSLLLIHDIERYPDRDDSTYIAILKSSVISTKIYGDIELDLEKLGGE